MMIKPVSQPVVPAQPDTEFYSPQELALFKMYSRDTYRGTFGIEAPAYNPARRLKSWFDSSVDVSDPSNVAVYRIVAKDQSGNWTLRQMVMPAEEAASVNLPGAISYAAYVVAPTRATRGDSVLNAIYLSLEAEARALMEELGGSGLESEELPGFPVSYPPDEPRRLWRFLRNGRPVNVGSLLLNRNSQGVGAPGHWDPAAGEPIWVPDSPGPTGIDDRRPAREMPVRDLLPNEKLSLGLMGTVGVMRTDLQQAADETSGKFTPEDRATLRMIHQLVSKLAG